MNLVKQAVLTIILLTTSVCLRGQANDIRLDGLDEEIIQWMSKYDAVGLSISIVENEALLYNNSFGYADLDNKRPVTENTVFPIASCSKAFTATLLGMLEEEDQLKLADRPSAHIESLRFNTTEMDNSVSISDLLSHKSGIGGVDGTLVLFPENNRMRVIEKLKYIRPEGKVKESSIYSNLAYTLAGTIVEEVTGKRWENNIQNRIFDPLKMAHSFTSLEDARKEGELALGYGLYRNEIVKVNYEQYGDYKPAGGIKSTTKDLSSWMIAWLNDGRCDGVQVIPEKFVKKARRFHNSREGEDSPDLFLQGYGLGWRVETRDGEFRVLHGGNTSGFTTLLVTYPFKKFGIAILVNQDDSLLPYILADIVQNRMLHKKSVTDYPVVVHDIYQPSDVKASINEEKPPSKSLASFVGEYEHKGYGKVRIILEEDRLYAIYPTYKFFLEHLYNDIFVMKPTEDVSDVFNPEFTVSFNMDANGEITSFAMNLQSDPVEFSKKLEN